MWMQRIKVTLFYRSVKNLCRFLGSIWNMVGCYLLHLASDPRECIVCLSVSGDGCEPSRPSFSLRQMLVHVCEHMPESYQHFQPLSEKTNVLFLPVLLPQEVKRGKTLRGFGFLLLLHFGCL